MQAAELWNLEAVQWMLKSDESVKADVATLVKLRTDTEAFLQFARGISTVLSQAKKMKQDHGLCDGLQKTVKMLEDRRC